MGFGRWGSESDGFMTGTEGGLAYDISGGGTCSLSWNNPYVGHNSYGGNATPGFAVATNGSDGDNAVVTFILMPSK